MRRAALLLALLAGVSAAEAQPVRPVSQYVLRPVSRGFFPLYVPVLAQVTPGSPFGGGGAGAIYPVSDEVWKVCDNGDATKCVEFELTGMTTGNTIPITMTGTAAAPKLEVGGLRIGITGVQPEVRGNANGVNFIDNTENTFVIGGGFGTSIASNSCYGINSTADNANGSATDTLLCKDDVAAFQLGVDVNGAAINQTLKAHDGITGTDISGAGLTLAAGRGTGTGTNFVQIQTSPSLATGTTAQTLETRDYIHSGTKAIPDNTATAFVDIGVVTDDAGSVQVFYEVKAENATDQCVISGIATVAYYNDAGTEACGTIVEAGETSACSGGGTTTATITCTVALTDEVRLNMTSDNSFNVTGVLKWRIIGGTIGAVQPQ